MENSNNTIALLRPDGKRGTTLKTGRYKTLAEYMVNLLVSKESITFAQVLESARGDLPGWDENTAQDLLLVKLDLEARGYLHMRAPRYDRKLQFLKLIQSPFPVNLIGFGEDIQ